jgi:opacity protein-like surface antigen
MTTPHFTPYAHALFGADHTWQFLFAGLAETHTAFAMALGGGVDIPLSSHFVVRAAQADYLYSNHGDFGQNNLRVSTGVVFRFGE